MCVFQPHQHSRTRALLTEFGQAFGDADVVLLPEILRDYKNFQYIIFGAILFSTMAFMPGGIMEAAARIWAKVKPRGAATTATAAAQPSAAE